MLFSALHPGHMHRIDTLTWNSTQLKRHEVHPSICKVTDVCMKSEKPERKRKQLLMSFFLKGTVHFLTVGEGFPVAVALIAAQSSKTS